MKETQQRPTLSNPRSKSKKYLVHTPAKAKSSTTAGLILPGSDLWCSLPNYSVHLPGEPAASKWQFRKHL